MKENKITTEHLLYWLAFLLALFLRTYQLGAGALSDAEAGWALQALGVAHGEVAALGAQPAYIILTSQLFTIMSASNFLARLYPAIAGSLLVWLPFFFRRWTGASLWLQRAGLVMAFGLALDPGLVSLSRQVGSPIPALAFTLLSLACLYDRRMVLMGIFAGLALLSGPAFLQGLLMLGISWGLYSLVARVVFPLQSGEQVEELTPSPISSRSIVVALSAFLGTVFVAGTLVLSVPQGLGALADTIPAYLETWVGSSGIPLLRLPASLLVYQPLVLIFAIIAALRLWFGRWHDQESRHFMLGLSLWAVVAFLLPLLYAGHQVGDMVWALVPLWALAATEISRATLPEQDKVTYIVSGGLGALLFVLAVVGWINLISLGRFQTNLVAYLAIIIGALVLGFIAILLVAASWSTSAARLGVVLSLCVLLGLLMFSYTWGMAVLRQNGVQDLWSVPPSTGQADNLNQTLADLSNRNTGLEDQLEIVTLVDSSALTWALRGFPNARYEDSLSPDESPPVVITLKETELLSLAENYRGQDFVWRLYPGWLGVFPPNFINWLAFRQAPLVQDQIILWARADLFPGGTLDETVSPIP